MKTFKEYLKENTKSFVGAVKQNNELLFYHDSIPVFKTGYLNAHKFDNNTKAYNTIIDEWKKYKDKVITSSDIILKEV